MDASNPAQGHEGEEFIGPYAFEGMPHWQEFEVSRSGAEFSIEGLRGFKSELRFNGKGLAGLDPLGNEVSLHHDPTTGQYSLDAVAVSTDGRRRTHRIVLTKALPPLGTDQELDIGVAAHDLVRGVRASEQWIHQVDSFRLRVKTRSILTEEGIAFWRRQESQGVIAGSSDLVPLKEDRLEICFDQRRLRTSREGSGPRSGGVQICDGETYTSSGWFGKTGEPCYTIRPWREGWDPVVWSSFAWLRTQPHRFWWSAQGQRDARQEDAVFGLANDFVLTGTRDYRGTDCYVLECHPEPGTLRRWFVGIQDGLLRGLIFTSGGYPCQDFWMDDYREVGPGWRYPMTQGYSFLESRSEEDSLPPLTVGHMEVLTGQIVVNQPLSDDLFRMEFQEGVMVVDERFGAQVTYPYKKDRTKAEWDQIRQEAARKSRPPDGPCRSCGPA